MKKIISKSKKIVCMILAVTLTFGTQNVSAATATRRINGNSSNGTYIAVTTSTVADNVKEYSESRAMHRKGVSTTYEIRSTKSKTSTASATIESTVGAEYVGVSASVSASLGVSESVSSEKSCAVTWTVPAEYPDQVYYIAAVFPSAQASFDIYKMRDSKKVGSLIKGTIYRMPLKNRSYYDLLKG